MTFLTRARRQVRLVSLSVVVALLSVVAGAPALSGAVAQHAAALDGKPVIAFIMSDGNVCKYGPGGWC
jgi:hypothetical protein